MQAHTCANTLELPNYCAALRAEGRGGHELEMELSRVLHGRLLTAVTHCTTFELGPPQAQATSNRCRPATLTAGSCLKGRGWGTHLGVEFPCMKRGAVGAGRRRARARWRARCRGWRRTGGRRRTSPAGARTCCTSWGGRSSPVARSRPATAFLRCVFKTPPHKYSSLHAPCEAFMRRCNAVAGCLLLSASHTVLAMN